MSRTNGKERRGGSANGKGVPAVLRAAFVHALKSEQYSEARAARAMGVSLATVERYVSGASDVNAKYPLQSKRLWRPFWLCVSRLLHKGAK